MNAPSPTWQYNEFHSVGRDYGLPDEAAVYDTSHADFRDIQAENNRVLDRLGLEPGQTLLDFGAGTGTFAIEAARRGLVVHAIDVSEAMLARARHKASEAGVRSLHFHHAGFLTFTHPAACADAITTTFAFHHLPDFWKGLALQRLRRLLRPGGQFYLHDVILEETNALENIAHFIDRQAKAGGAFLKEDAEGHFKEEYSTYAWIMDGLLERAGFTIQHRHLEGGVLGTYLCRKI